MDHKKQNLRFCSSNIECWQYWSSEQICYMISEAVVQGCPVKKVFLKFLQNSSKNIRDAFWICLSMTEAEYSLLCQGS